ncbi:HNH endonuclease signature motif containing protein [Arthrobacter sp.]|uniref:HNH endonuclease signature motif containing protein n=1 Tax=Arthrobacter sp. TaxID=1667 RepID=UPI003A8D2BBF
MTEKRPEIGQAIKREVRQRCGFGCIFCGIPVYHYDHISEYSTVKQHSAENITLLCGYHHDLKTRGQIPTEVVRIKNQEPVNKPQGETAPHTLFYYGNSARIVAGGNEILTSDRSVSALKIDGHSLVDFELVEGQLMLNMDFRDKAGEAVLTVRKNELVHSTHLWDYEFVSKTLTIRERRGNIYISITFSPDKQSVILAKGLVSHNGIDVLFDARGLCILNNRTMLSGNSVRGIDTAISVGVSGPNSPPSAVHIDVSRGPYDQQEAISWARKQMSRAKINSNATTPRIDHSMIAPGTKLTWMSIAFMPYPWALDTCRRPR